MLAVEHVFAFVGVVRTDLAISQLFPEVLVGIEPSQPINDRDVLVSDRSLEEVATNCIKSPGSWNCSYPM